MVIYICLASLLIFLLYLNKTSFYFNNICREVVFSLSSLILFILYVFRGVNVGTDYPMYHLFFHLRVNEMESHLIEKGYIFLNQFAQSNNMFIIIPSVIFMVVFYGCYFLSRQLDIDKFTFLCFFVLSYFYLFSFNALRQFLALGFVCIGLGLFFKFYNKKFIKYVILISLILFAKLFHTSAIFCIIFLFLPFIKIKSWHVLIFGIFTSVFYFNNFISNIINKLLFFSPQYLQKYGTTETLIFNKNIFALIPIIIQFIYLFIFVENNYISNYKIKFIISGYLLYLILFSAGSSVISERLQTYTYIFPLLFSCIVFMNKNKLNRIKVSELYKSTYILFIIVYYIFKLITNNSGVIPYYFI